MKEQLVKLAKICINNKYFYNTRSSILFKSIESKIKSYECDKLVKSHTQPFYTIDGQLVDCRYYNSFTRVLGIDGSCDETTFFNFVCEFYKNEDTYERSGEMVINFEDQPPLRLYTKEENKTCKVIQTKEIDTFIEKYVKSFLFGIVLGSKMVKDKPVKVEGREYEYTYKFYISSGSIVEELTKEEYNELIDLYTTTEREMKRKADESKILERISKYEVK